MEELTKQAVRNWGSMPRSSRSRISARSRRHGILSTPGLVVNGKIKHTGKPLPSLEK